VSIEDVQKEIWQQIQWLEAATTPSIRVPAPTIQSPLKLHKLEMFGGKGKESIDAWLFSLRRYFDHYQTGSKDRVSYAAALLKDDAAIWWRYHIHLVDAGESI